jgi:aminocarboxymuconate-semialdehyde decarboxylase
VRIDIHNHVIPESVVHVLESDRRYPVRIVGDTMRAFGTDYDLPTFVDPERRLATLRHGGLEGAIVSIATQLFFYELEASAAEDFCHAANEGLAEYARHDAARYHWMAHLPLQDVDASGRVLAAAADAGSAGVFMATTVVGRPLDVAGLEPVFAEIERRSLPIFLHPNYNDPHPALGDYYLQNVIGNLMETTAAIERLICAGVLDRHPGLRIILAHGGGYYPYQAGRLRHARTVRPELRGAPEDPFAYRDQLLVDTLTHDPGTLRFAIDRMGVDHVVMGTDIPYDMSTPDPMGALLEAVDEATARQIAETNIERLYRLEPATVDA